MSIPKLTLLLPLLVACDDGGPVCTLEAGPGIVVEVKDSVSGEALTVPVTAIATDGEFTDTLLYDAPYSRGQGADERPGTYTLTVHAAGYAVWSRSDVVVSLRDDGCHVVATGIVALMQPE